MTAPKPHGVMVRTGFCLMGLMVLNGTLMGSALNLPSEIKGDPAQRAIRLQAESRSQGPSPSALTRLAPHGIFIVVDTAQNLVYLRQGTKTMYTAVASTGSGARLQDPQHSLKDWVFDTPRGIFSITGKVADPVWFKPDWAFIEEGRPIPTQRKDRAEGGVLGDYAIGFGDGYFIHGTLYTRLLGSNVTHGCIRLGDQDLKYIYDHVAVGTTLIIF